MSKRIENIVTKVRNILMLQNTSNNSEPKKLVYSYDTNFSHKEGAKKFYNISYVHNRDVVPGGTVKQAKRIKYTIV